MTDWDRKLDWFAAMPGNWTGPNPEGTSAAVRGGLAGRFAVVRHGTGRKYWEAHYPDGTHVDNFTTQSAAKLSCESWRPDDSLVAPDVDELSAEADDELEGGQDDLTDDVDEGQGALTDRPAEKSGSTDASTAATNAGTGQDQLTLLEQLLSQVDLTDAGDKRADWGRALKNLRPLAQARAELDTLIADQVARSRLQTERPPGDRWWYNDTYGMPTWEDVGKALGVTKQSAQARYGKKP